MISWIALIFIFGAIGLEIYLRHKNDPEKEQLKIQCEKYRSVIAELGAVVEKLPQNAALREECVDYAIGICQSTLGEKNEVR